MNMMDFQILLQRVMQKAMDGWITLLFTTKVSRKVSQNAQHIQHRGRWTTNSKRPCCEILVYTGQWVYWYLKE